MSTPSNSLARKLVAEFVGTMLLLAIVVGSGIMGDRLAGGNVAIALLANTLATGAGLVVLIWTFGGLSGAHFNPVVSTVMAARRELPWSQLPGYLFAQQAGAMLGVVLAHAMFALPLVQVSQHVRTGSAQWISEAVATFGLLLVILNVSRRRPEATPVAVGLYITSAYWFTASTSFANPAVTVARSMTNTFAGIRPVDIAGFVVAQCVGATVAAVLSAWLLKDGTSDR